VIAILSQRVTTLLGGRRAAPLEDAGAPAAGRAGHRRTATLCAFALGVGVFVYWLAHTGITDDGYITLDYARNVAMHARWGLAPGLTSNTATSPLNVLFLATVMEIDRVFTGGPLPLVALGVITVGSMVATAGWFSRLSRATGVSTAAGVVGLGMYLLSPLALSGIGLETALLIALAVGLVAEAARGRPVAFGVLAGLALLTRLDAVLFVLILGLGSRAIRRGWYKAIAPLLAIALPWFVFSWYHLGSAIPATLAIKQFQIFPGRETFASGIELFTHGNAESPAGIAVIPAALGAAALLCWAGPRALGKVSPRLGPLALFGFAGAVYYAAYLELGVPPYTWYYIPTLASLTLFAAAALDPVPLGSRLAELPRARRWAARAPRLAGGVLVTALAAFALHADVAQGLPWAYPPVFGNQAKPADYARVGSDLGRHGITKVQSPGELGTLVYYCHCQILDQFSDPGLSLLFVKKQVATAGPVMRRLYRWNYDNLDTDRKPVTPNTHLVWAPRWVAGADRRPHVWNVCAPAPGKGHYFLGPTQPVSNYGPPPHHHYHQPGASTMHVYVPCGG
jgi:hypothetical protein